MTNTAYLAFGALIVYLAQSMFGNIMPFTAPIFYIMLGLAIREIDNQKLESEDNSDNEI